jgi:hypothetical protein
MSRPGRPASLVRLRERRFPDKPMGDHGLHDWWYGCLARAGVVAPGTTSGERMHNGTPPGNVCST